VDVLVGTGVAVGVAVTTTCRVGRHSANKPAIAASLMNFRLEVPRGQGLSSR
jgi:hypothetical protein